MTPAAATLRVSDHALLRFLTRAGGYDVEGIREALAASLQRAHSVALTVDAANYIVRVDGLTYIVRGGTVVTVVGRARRRGHEHAK